MIKKYRVLTLFILVHCSYHLHAHNAGVYIIVHGTWAATSSWAKPGGDFFDALEKSAHKVHANVTSYTWSGNLDNASRHDAGKGLAKMIASYPPTTPIYLVGHSHGANVCILACKELAKDPNNLHRIEALFTLGVPINTYDYMPPMDGIGAVYNFFSCEDLYQPVLGIYGRIYPDHERIANMRVFIHNRQPDHGQLHDPIIGAWLPTIHKHCTKKEGGLSDLRQTVICFSHDKPPFFYFDSERNSILEQDRILMQNLLTVFRKKQLTTASS